MSAPALQTLTGPQLEQRFTAMVGELLQAVETIGLQVQIAQVVAERRGADDATLETLRLIGAECKPVVGKLWDFDLQCWQLIQRLTAEVRDAGAPQ